MVGHGRLRATALSLWTQLARMMDHGGVHTVKGGHAPFGPSTPSPRRFATEGRQPLIPRPLLLASWPFGRKRLRHIVIEHIVQAERLFCMSPAPAHWVGHVLGARLAFGP